MATLAITASPALADFPSLIINHTGEHGVADAYQMNCGSSQIAIPAETRFIRSPSFCDPDQEIPSRIPARQINVDVTLSYGDPTNDSVQGLWNALKPFEGKRTSFASVHDHTIPVGTNNPEVSGYFWMPPIPDIVAPAPGEPPTASMQWKIISSTYVTTTDPLAAVAVHPLGV